ncbi:hypothetical protein BH23CHL8_BH23CHL8_20870 [soil metagenome]
MPRRQGRPIHRPPATRCGYAYGKKPILLVRTDFRAQTGSGAPYNPMLTESATIRLDMPFAPLARVVAEVLDALGLAARVPAGQVSGHVGHRLTLPSP